MANYVCLLSCGHTVFYEPPPKAGETVYCRRCMRYQRVKLASQEWSWHCAVCHISRPFGADMDAARAGARRHQRKYHHVVLLRQGYNAVEAVGPEGQGELSIVEERVEWVRAHQGALRAAVEQRIVAGTGKRDRP